MSILVNTNTKVNNECRTISSSPIPRMGEGGAERLMRARDAGRIAGGSAFAAGAVLARAKPALIRPSGTFSHAWRGRRVDKAISSLRSGAN